MPILLYFVVVGSGLLGLLLGVNAMLPEGPPAVISSNFAGLPKLHPHQGTDLTDRSTAPAPDMRSPEVLAAAPHEQAVKSREVPVAVAIAVPKPKKHKVARRAPEPGQYAAVAQNPDQGPHFGWGNRPAWGQSDDQARDQRPWGQRQVFGQRDGGMFGSRDGRAFGQRDAPARAQHQEWREHFASDWRGATRLPPPSGWRGFP